MPAPFVEDAFFFLLYNFGFFVKNLVFIDVWIYVTVFDWIPLIHVSVFMPIPIFFITQLCSKAWSWGWWCLRSSFIVHDCFSYHGFFCFFFLYSSLVLFSQGLWVIVLVFQWGLHGICRLLLVKLLFLLCKFYLSKRMGYHSVFWYFLQLLSSKS